MSDFQNNCQRLIQILNETQSGDTALIRKAERELLQVESPFPPKSCCAFEQRHHSPQQTTQRIQIEKRDGFIPFLLKFIALTQDKQEHGRKPYQAASIRLKNLIKYRWKSLVSDSDKVEIRKSVFEQCLNQKDPSIRRQLFTTMTYLIKEDFPNQWPNLMQIIGESIKTNNPYMILGGLSVLLTVFKKYHYVSRKREDNPMEKMIDDTFPTLCNIFNITLDHYHKSLQQQQGQLNHELNVVLNVLKVLFRIFFVAFTMEFPKHLQNNGLLETWLNLFLRFFKIDAPSDLKLPKSNKALLTVDSLYSIQQYAKYYDNPYVKARKWAVRCITRMLQLYGRPKYCANKAVVPFAKLFMDKYARKFMEHFYFRILKQHVGDQFVYFKTLAPAITYINLCVHYGSLFSLLLEDNHKCLDHIIFECMFRIVRLTAKDLSQWNDDPQGFVESSFRYGMGIEDHYDPRICALKFIQDAVRIRSRYTFDKLLEFSQKMIQEAHQLQIQHQQQMQQSNGASNTTPNSNGHPQSPDAKYLDAMVNKDAVLCILGHLANILRKANKEQYVNALRDLIMKHVMPDYRSPFGFLRARACWLVGKYWKLKFSQNEWQQIGVSMVKALNDSELPVQMEASAGLSRIVLEKSGDLLEFLKPEIPAILGRYLEIMNDIGTEAVVQTFDTLIDRLDHGIIPFATDLLQKMMEMFKQFHQGIETYVRQHPEEYENFMLPTGNVANQRDPNSDGAEDEMASKMARSEEAQKELLRTFDEHLASALQCLKAMHTILFASTALPALLAKLEEVMQPLVARLFNDEYLYFQFYKEEILDFLHLFSFYMEPLSIYCWKLFPQILDGYAAGIWSDQFNRCTQCAVNYIKAAQKNKLPFEQFMNHNFVEVVLNFADIAIHDDNINILMFTSLFENMLCCFKNSQNVDMSKYVPRILEMAMTKFTEKCCVSPNTRGGMLAIVALVAFNNPTLLIELCERNQSTDTILSLLINNYQDLMWPQQKVMVFGLSELLLIPRHKMSQSLIAKYPQILQATAKCIVFMNYEDSYSDDEEEENDHGANDNDDDDEDTEEMANGHSEEMNGRSNGNNKNDEDGDDEKVEMEDEEEEMDGSVSGNELIDVAENADYVDQNDLKYMQTCCDMEGNQEWLDAMMEEWDDNSSVVPRSLLDEKNEVIYFYNCLNKFKIEFPEMVKQWENNLSEMDRNELAKYLRESEENQVEFQKRKVQVEKDKAERQEMAMKAIEAASKASK